MANAYALLPTSAKVENAVAILYALIAGQPQHPAARPAKAALVQIARFVESVYAADVALDLTDATDATVAVAAVTTGEISAQFKAKLAPSGLVADADALPSKGKVVSVADTADTTDDGLEAALDAKAPNDCSLTFTYTDTTEATLAAAFAATAVIPVALGRALRVGDIIKLNGTGDTTDNAFEAAKGGAVAAADRFIVTSTAVPAVTFIKNDTPMAGQLYQFTSATAVAYVGQRAPSFSDLFPTADVTLDL